MKRLVFVCTIFFIFLFSECAPLYKGPPFAYSTVVYNNNRWVATGSNAAIFTSLDGSFWVNVGGKSSLPLYSVAYGNNKWLAVGQTGIAFLSADCISWIRTTIEADSYLQSIFYANNTWVGVGIANNGSGTVSTSTDGQVWVRRHTNHYKLNSIAYGNNMWIAVGDNGIIIASSDGITWTTRFSGTTMRLNTAMYSNGIWIITVQDNIVLTSADGVSWTKRFIGEGYFQSVCCGNGLWVGVGLEGDGYGIIATSHDGISWTKRVKINYKDSWLNSVAYGNNKWIAVGHQGIMLASADGITWEIQ